MDTQQIILNFDEVIMYVFLLGGIVYLIGFVTSYYIMLRQNWSHYKILAFSLLKLVISIMISLAIWSNWIFNFDIMFLFVFIPALLSESILILILILMIKTLLYNKH